MALGGGDAARDPRVTPPARTALRHAPPCGQATWLRFWGESQTARPTAVSCALRGARERSRTRRRMLVFFCRRLSGQHNSVLERAHKPPLLRSNPSRTRQHARPRNTQRARAPHPGLKTTFDPHARRPNTPPKKGLQERHEQRAQDLAHAPRREPVQPARAARRRQRAQPQRRGVRGRAARRHPRARAAGEQSDRAVCVCVCVCHGLAAAAAAAVGGGAAATGGGGGGAELSRAPLALSISNTHAPRSHNTYENNNHHAKLRTRTASRSP